MNDKRLWEELGKCRGNFFKADKKLLMDEADDKGRT